MAGAGGQLPELLETALQYRIDVEDTKEGEENTKAPQHEDGSQEQASWTRRYWQLFLATRLGHGIYFVRHRNRNNKA
jgi:hypothetical protein